MNASRGSRLTKFILKHSLERRHQSKPLPGAVKRFLRLPSPTNVCACAATIAIFGLPHLLPLQRRLRLFSPSQHPWAVYSTCTPLSSLPSTTYLFIAGCCLADRHQIFVKRRRQTDIRVRLCSVMGDTVSMNSVLPGVKAPDKFG